MKTQIITKKFNGTTLTAYIMSDADGAMLDMNGWDRQYFKTVAQAKARATKMFATEIDNLKYA